MGDAVAAKEKLCAQQLQVILYHGYLSLTVKVGYVRDRMATRRNSEGAILDALEIIKGGLTQVGRPDCGTVIYGRHHIRPINPEQGFLMATPSRASEGVEDP